MEFYQDVDSSADDLGDGVSNGSILAFYNHKFYVFELLMNIFFHENLGVLRDPWKQAKEYTAKSTYRLKERKVR